MRTHAEHFWESLRSTYWFIPAAIILSMICLAYLTQLLDERQWFDIATLLPGVFNGGPDGARSMLSTIAGSMMTAAAVTFSITIAALASTSSQYGPRLLRIFMRDVASQVVLGTLVGTFIYCLLILRQVPSTSSSLLVPHFATTMAMLLALACIVALIYFIHHMASLLQISNVAAHVGNELLSSIENMFPENLGQGAEIGEREDAISLSGSGTGILPDADQKAVEAHRIGYIQAIDNDKLMALAIEHDAVIQVDLRPGRFIVQDTRLAVIWPGTHASPDLESALQKVFLIGSRRTPYQDIELYFDELTEIALRAMSPGINDPYTAIICIDWLTGGLTALSRRQMPSRYRYDDDNHLRVIADGPSLADLIDASFDRIRNVSRSHPSVLLKLLESIRLISQNVRFDDDRAALRRQLQAIDVVARHSGYIDHERRRLYASYLEALKDLNIDSD